MTDHINSNNRVKIVVTIHIHLYDYNSNNEPRNYKAMDIIKKTKLKVNKNWP